MSRQLLSRRAFLRLGALAGIGAALAALNRITTPVSVFNYLHWLARGEWQRRVGTRAIVALGECASYTDDVLGHLRELWRLAEMPDVRGKRILVKPNLVDYIDNHPSTTAPEVVGAVIDLLGELGASELVVGDGPAFRRQAGPVVEGCGLAAVLEARGIRFIDLNYDDPQPVPVKDGWLTRSPFLWLPRHVREADMIVSVPKLKTHHWAKVSLSVKNLLGVVPGARYGWPKNILHINGFIPSILGVYQLVPPVVAVVDGIVGMEGDGPLFGEPVQHGLLAVGRDPVAVDVTCAGLMGFELEFVDYLSLAAWTGVGQATRIETRGASPERLQQRYELPPSEQALNVLAS